MSDQNLNDNLDELSESDSVNIDVDIDLDIDETNNLLDDILTKLDDIYVYLNEFEEQDDVIEVDDELTLSEQILLELSQDFKIILSHLDRDDDLNLFDDDVLLSLHNINDSLQSSLEIQTSLNDSIDVIEESSLLSAAYLIVFVPFVAVTYYIYSLFKNFIIDYY